MEPFNSMASTGRRNKLTQLASAGMLISILGGAAAHAQESLQGVVQADRNLRNRQQPVTPEDYPVTLGPVNLFTSIGYGVTYDDNTNLRSDNPEWDLIHQLSLNFNFLWPITDQSRLAIGVGLQYSIYTEGTRDNRLSLTPNSNIAYDFTYGNTYHTIYNDFSFNESLLEQGELSNVSEFGRFQNTIGFRSSWAPEPLLFQAGYSHNLVIATEEANEDLDRDTDTVFLRGAYLFYENTQAGLEATASHTYYDVPIRNDFYNETVGPYVEWQVTQSINLSARGGLTFYQYDDTGTDVLLDDATSWYAGLSASHQLTEYFSHTLSADRGFRVGITSQRLQTTSVRYGFNWEIYRYLRPSVSVFWERGEQPSEEFSEDYDRYGASIGFGFRLAEKLNSGISYQFTHRDSTDASRTYDNNRISANLSYRF